MVIKILGAGIAGLTSAIKLRQLGEEATIFERNSEVGAHLKADIQAIRNYDVKKDQFNEFKDFGLEINDFHPIYQIKKFAPSGKFTTIFSEKQPLFYSFKRGNNADSLDTQLFRQAIKEGVKIQFRQHKTPNTVDIIATGAVFKEGKVYGITFKAENIDNKTILFYMDNRYAPRGYIYAIPYGKDEISVATTSLDPAYNLRELLFNFLSKNKETRKIIKSAKKVTEFSGFAYYNIPKTAVVNNKIFVGGAAGFIDPARGFGIKYAIESGILAARAITGKLDYDALWKVAFEKELFDGFKRRLVFNKMKNKDYENLISGNSKINVKRYNKVSNEIEEMFLEFNTEVALESWRKKHNLKQFLSK